MTMTEYEARLIDEGVALLYRLANIEPPTTQRPIVPLSRLVSDLKYEDSNLLHWEMRGLNSEEAMQQMLAHGGLLKATQPTSREPLAGFLFCNSRVGLILVEGNDPVTRKRFSVAHELGHYILHFLPTLRASNADEREEIGLIEMLPPGEAENEALPEGKIGWQQPEAQLMPLSQQAPLSHADMERQANAFAGALLMPENVVRELASRLLPQFRGEDLAGRLATDFLVSRAAMRWRLRDLGLWPVNAALN